MKYLYLCFFLIGCGREADLIKVNNNYVEKAKFEALMPSEVNADSKVRAMTLISYPLSKDVSVWSFEIGEETKESWTMFMESLSFSDRLITNFIKEENAATKIQQIVTLVQSAGESRDQAYKKISPIKKDLQKIDDGMITLKSEKTPKDLESMVCFYTKKPAAGKNYECKSKLEGEFKKEKTAATCKDFVKFTFTDTELNAKVQESQLACSELQKSLDDLKAESKKIDDKIAFETSVRSAGESIVLDLLQSVERTNPGLVLIATGATIEKNKDVNDAISKVVVSKSNEITTLSLIIDFGPNLSSGSGKVEYSLENGKIQNLSFKKEVDGVWTLKFDIVTSDFTVKTSLAYTVHPTLGMRFVGDAFFYYPNNVLRKGVMKLEFDLL